MLRYVLLCFVLCVPAFAGDPQFWGHYTDEVRSWFPTVMQPGFEHQTGNQGHSCCGEADAFEARITGEDPVSRDIIVVIDNGKTLIPDGTVVNVPREKIQTNYGNPTGKVVIFISIGSPKSVYCLVPLPYI